MGELYEVESNIPFSESLIWKLNQDFYHNKGIAAWSDDIVPHHMTSNSKVGKTYAELILAFLKDLATKGKTEETVYIVELGAGHGRLAFHILNHLQTLLQATEEKTPPYCYVLSDIVEENLAFFQIHPQFQTYLKQGILDVSFFDGLKSEQLFLRHSEKSIQPKDLEQPLVAIANYFFDSLPTELFQIQENEILSCSVSIYSKNNPKEVKAETLLKDMDLSYHLSPTHFPFHEDPLLDDILNDYKNLLSSTYLFFPKKGFDCLKNLTSFSKAGLMLLTMDKGFHEIHNLENKKEPDIITHGSISIWVNYHAFISYCKKQGGKALFPSFSNFHLEIGCLLFMEESESFSYTDAAYQQFVNDFGPDDFNSIKQLTYSNISKIKLKELIALYRLSDYDSTFFMRLLPRLKQVAQTITLNERKRLEETLGYVWNMYFNINENFDLAFEIGCLLYDLGYFAKALNYYQHSVNFFGQKADIYYNQILCLYQLRQDTLFHQVLNEAKISFPDYELFKKLDQLDMS